MSQSLVISRETAVIVLDGSGSIEYACTGAKHLLGPKLDDCRHAADLFHAFAPALGGHDRAVALWQDLTESRPEHPLEPLSGRAGTEDGNSDILFRFLPTDNKVILAIDKPAAGISKRRAKWPCSANSRPASPTRCASRSAPHSTTWPPPRPFP